MAAYVVVNEKVTAEAFDGEIVLINVEKGLYFSLQGSAIELWKGFSSAQAPEDVLDAFTAEVAGADRQALQEAIARMQENELLVSAPEPASHAPAPSFANAAFTMPALEVYSDLAELIAIDPVHEVDAEAGWPLRPANFPDVT